MRLGYWQPIFGGWLRNVDDEGMQATWEYNLAVARAAENAGFDVTLIAELNLNDIKGPEEPTLEAWSTAAALAACTSRLEIMAAVRPSFHNPALTAKMAANIDHISGGRFTLNIVSAWWADEARRYGVPFDQHEERYARTGEFLRVLKGMWSEPNFSFEGRYYHVEEGLLSPAPVQKPWPRLYAGGESDTAKELIARECDAYLMHGDPPELVAPKIADMRARRETLGLPSMTYGLAAYCIVRPTEEEARAEVARITDVRASSRAYHSYQDFVSKSKLEREVSLEDYSVSNRGLRAGLVGTPEQVATRIAQFEAVGVDLLLMQSSPQLEEIERFGREVTSLVRRGA
ncbi:MAG: LLM class flavin-dependent oxidoreductase [Chloroflexia bacterium]|nr:LLM class flavin-dependent oxidoreductase [Chloroflexia bacterium]